MDRCKAGSEDEDDVVIYRGRGKGIPCGPTLKDASPKPENRRQTTRRPSPCRDGPASERARASATPPNDLDLPTFSRGEFALLEECQSVDNMVETSHDILARSDVGSTSSVAEAISGAHERHGLSSTCQGSRLAGREEGYTGLPQLTQGEMSGLDYDSDEDFDVMDWERPSVKGATGSFAIGLLDKECGLHSESILAVWNRDRARKRQRKAERERQRTQGQATDGSRASHTVHGLRGVQLREEISIFFTSGQERYV